MEYCDLGQLMLYNNNFDGYEYNKIAILVLLENIFLNKDAENPLNELNLNNFLELKNNLLNLLKEKKEENKGKIFFI